MPLWGFHLIKPFLVDEFFVGFFALYISLRMWGLVDIVVEHNLKDFYCLFNAAMCASMCVSNCFSS